MPLPLNLKRALGAVAASAVLGATGAATASAAQPAAPPPAPAPAAAPAAAPASAPAVPTGPATHRRPVRQIVLPQWALDLAGEHRRQAGRPARPGSARRAASYRMTPHDVRRLLRVSWKAFGYTGSALELRVASNSRQIRRESTRRPSILQGYIGDVNDRRPAGGLMQFVTGTFRHWQVGNRDDRFNPLDNILAAVNAQVHGPHRVLSGRSGWSPRLSPNPLRGADAVAVLPA